MSELVAKTLFGIETVLAEELRGMGAQQIKILNRAVSFTGDKRMLYRANYCLRTALKILVPIGESVIQNEKELYDVVRSVRWDNHLAVDDTLAVEVTLKSDLFSHSQYVAQKIKDGIVDQFRDHYGRRPSVDLDQPSLRVNAYISNRNLVLSVDSSGDPLYRRGYRIRQGPAPLNEVLAAGLILLSGWNRTSPFIDFMCGSGTLPIEAAMLAAGMPPGVLGRPYGFQKWKDYEPALFRELEKEYRTRTTGKIQVHAADISPEAVKLSMQHAGNAGVAEYIHFSTCHFEDFIPPSEPGLLLINPPYGERIVPGDILQLYTELGNKLKKSFAGYEAWVLSANLEALKNIGLRPSKRLSLYNGQLECKFHCFSMYAGTKKTHKYGSS
jgi:putative N6-adenine-specific DNA methylase